MSSKSNILPFPKKPAPSEGYPVTSPIGSAAWEDEVWTNSIVNALRRVAREQAKRKKKEE